MKLIPERLNGGSVGARLLIGLLGGLAACSDAPSNPKPSDDAAVTPTPIVQPIALTRGQRDRLIAARKQTEWVGESHHVGMQVVIEEITRLRKAKRPIPKAGSRAYCDLLERVGNATLAVLDRHRGIQATYSQRASRIRSEPGLRRCSQALSIFGPPAIAHTAPLQEYNPEVTGVYETYLDPMEAGVINSGGSVSAVQNAVDAVLARAVSDGIPEGDLLALSSFASLAVSSAQEWNAFDWSLAGGAYQCADGTCNLMSVFFHRQSGSGVGKVVGADVAGCLSAVKSWGALQALLATPAWKALGAHCGVRGAIGSGIAIMAMM